MVNKNKIKKVAIYVRNSTTKIKQNPQVQIQPLKKKCELEGWEYVIFQEFASGSKETRPELDHMMQRIRAKEFDAVLVWRLDRLGRSIKHLLQLIEEFKKKDVKFISLTESFDTSTAAGELFLNIVASFAQFERSLIQERIMAGLDVARAEHKTLGRPPGKKDKEKRASGGYLLSWERRKRKTHPPSKHKSSHINKVERTIR